jgi:DNA-binding transcriptional ArsR family regulator
LGEEPSTDERKRRSRLLVAVPSAATHHLRILERVGFVERRREGCHMLVRRTPRGSEILELYDE